MGIHQIELDKLRAALRDRRDTRIRDKFEPPFDSRVMALPVETLI